MSAVENNGPTTNTEVFDIGFKLRQRLREMHDQKESTQAKINILSEQLQRMYARAPKKSRDTQRQMDDKIAKLEYQRTRVSLSLSDEKLLLRQIDMIKRSKKNLEDSQYHEHNIQEKKGEISSLRDNLRSMIAQIAELQSALSKVELAKRLGCNTTELKTMVLDCPSDKIGQIIGKNGSSLKQLENRTGVQIDVDKVGSKIHLEGSEAALNAAVREVENITLAVDVSVEMTKPVVNYLIAKRSAVLSKLQHAHPGVYFDVTRNSTKVNLRGLPDNVELAKIDIHTLDVKTTTRDLMSKETGLVVGKGGVTITKLSETHDVSLNVSDVGTTDGSMLEVTGPRDNVDNAIDEIEEILYVNAEIEEFVYVEPMQRNMFLANAAAVLKKTQKEIAAELGKTGGGVLLIFERNNNEDERQSKADPSKLIIRASRSIMVRAQEIVSHKITAFEATVSSITVDPAMIPAIIGKGGSTIKELRKDGVEIEVYKDSGLIKIQSTDDEAKTVVAEAIEQIVAENQSMTVAVNKPLIGLMFGDIGKEMRSKVMDDLGVKIIIDSSDEFVTLRGTVENNEEAARIINEFTENNFTLEFDIPSEDTPMLLHGGSENFLTKLGSTYTVTATLRFSKNIVHIRGLKQNVENAVNELRRFIFGGEGMMVYKLRIPEVSLGFIIGKGGAHITKVEKSYPGVTLDVMKGSNHLSMRGPIDMVKSCRSHLVMLLATTKVNDTIRITLEQHDVLAKAGTMSRITDGMGVEVSLTNSSVKLRGISTDIKAVNAMIMEQLNGKFEATVEFFSSQLVAVNKLKKDPAHFARIQDSTKVTLTVNSATSTIEVTGKRAGVKKAKNQLLMLLDLVFPGQFLRVKMPKAVLKAVAQPVTLGKVSAETGAILSLDREVSCVLIRSNSPDEVQAADSLLKVQISICEKRNVVMQLDSSDAWLITWLLSKLNAKIQNIQSEAGCKIIIDRSDLTISIIGADEEVASKGKAAVNAIILQCRKECVFLEIPDSAMSSFLGRNGSNCLQIANKSQAKIERLKKDPSRIQVQGSEEAVKVAVTLILKWVRAWETKNSGQSVTVPQFMIPILTGKNSFMNTIEQETQTKIDVNRRDCIVTIRGGSDGSRADAIQKINEIIQVEENNRIANVKAEIEHAKKISNEAKPKEPESLPQEKEDKRLNTFVAPTITAKENIQNQLPPESNSRFGANVFEQVNGKTKKSHANGFTKKVTQDSKDLFNMLVSDTVQEKSDYWDASNVSSVAVSGVDDGNEDEQPNEKAVVAPATKVYKSASGFSVRV